MVQFEEKIAVRSDLEELIADIEDVTDPSSMDKVLDYLEHIQEQDDDFIELLTQKLRYAVITWEQPWYQKEGCLTRQVEMGDNEETYVKGPLSKDEHEKMERNWRKLRKKYDLPNTLACLARWKNKNRSKNPNCCPEEQARRFAAAYLARGLQRTTYQIFRHILSHYVGHKRGFYDSVEEKIIEICSYHKPKLIAIILSHILGRQTRGLYKRLGCIYNGKEEKKRLKWNLALASKFLQSLLKHSGLQLEELKNRKFDKHVWLKVGEEMDQNYIYLQHFWYCYLHVQLFVKYDVKLKKLKKRLLKKLRASSYKVWTDIRWKDIAMEFCDGFTPRFLYRICNLTVMGFKGYLRAPLGDVVDYALQKIKTNGNRHNKRLKTLKLNKDGQLELVDYRTLNSANS